MSNAVFERKFKPIDAADGGQAWDFGDTKSYDRHQVWSLVDGDNGKPYIIPGYHLVNVFGYLVTEEPWDEKRDQDLVACWF
jgi:hypothetical protein